MRLILLLCFTSYGTQAFAQWQQSSWFHLDYTYTDFTYKEPGVMSEKGRLAGVRGEVGLNLLSWLALSAGGQYQDGNLNYDGSTFDGTPIKTVTKDYIRDTRALIHIVASSVSLSFGIAQRYWYDDLVISYRRRTRYDYKPIILTYHQNGLYVSYEHVLWDKGWNKSHMSDVDSNRRDPEFTLGKGSGMGVELGYLMPGSRVSTRVFVKYHKWKVKESDIQSDGTQALVEPNNNTTTYQIGIGLAF
ncbi:MAG: hypothetical protein AB7G93_19315 [Bdellovibrionales bacterium]